METTFTAGETLNGKAALKGVWLFLKKLNIDFPAIPLSPKKNKKKIQRL